ncbi:hypothetical protein B0H19DRAFT_1247177 [Mycena capillaripes]|nr:hypothetical protein B0H19DRAFT_1247177 [Mycena capillaripes]
MRPMFSHTPKRNCLVEHVMPDHYRKLQQCTLDTVKAAYSMYFSSGGTPHPHAAARGVRPEGYDGAWIHPDSYAPFPLWRSMTRHATPTPNASVNTARSAKVTPSPKLQRRSFSFGFRRKSGGAGADGCRIRAARSSAQRDVLACMRVDSGCSHVAGDAPELPPAQHTERRGDMHGGGRATGAGKYSALKPPPDEGSTVLKCAAHHRVAWS